MRSSTSSLKSLFLSVFLCFSLEISTPEHFSLKISTSDHYSLETSTPDLPLLTYGGCGGSLCL